MEIIMDSALPWKQEPVSPLSYHEVYLISEEPFYQTTDNVKVESELASCESKADVASHILENLENLMDLDELIKEEPFLLDEKMLPMLEDVEPPRAVPVPAQDQHIKIEYSKPDTQSLLKEFQNVYDVVGFNHGALTPPQSPPMEQPPMLTSLEPVLQPIKYASIPEKQTAVYSVPEKQLLPNGLAYRPLPVNNIHIEFPPVATPQLADIAHELAVVDELVRTRVEDMHWNSGPSSPSSSSSSNFGDCSSDDPEWVPETIENCIEPASPSKVSKKRSKPYSRSNPDDKKSRKKEQNKNAATRYRLKKKAEVEEILTEEKGLLDHNTNLGNQITDLQREIKYLKGLMRDLFKAKGLIN